MKTLAFYLPQFHEIEENNKWWGEGFTEWVNVKKATPLFKNRNQPREPLNDYYYNLLDVETLKWQSELAKKHNIDGFCFYHYWFNGKRLLDKPAE
ncbi:glycosyl transferase, partial [Escherichia coli]|nr:glycosyl transferase [Escherichia coli]